MAGEDESNSNDGDIVSIPEDFIAESEHDETELDKKAIGEPVQSKEVTESTEIGAINESEAPISQDQKTFENRTQESTKTSGNEAKENTKKPNISKPPVSAGKKSKIDFEKGEARLKLERRLKYNAQVSQAKPLPYKPYSGPLN